MPIRESPLVVLWLDVDVFDAGELPQYHYGKAPNVITTLEFDLLHFMAARPGRVYTREELMNHVWGEDRVVDDRSIDSLISRLRRKLERDPAHPQYIQTVWGAGYRFAEIP